MAGVFTMVSDGSVHCMTLPAGLGVLLAGVVEFSEAVLQGTPFQISTQQQSFWALQKSQVTSVSPDHYTH